MDYLAKNKESWNKKTEVHFNSEWYNNKGFIQGENSLKSIELELVGDVKSKSLLHLQCHFGQDSISWSRLGADVTAIDFSDKGIEKAKELNKLTGQDVNFICSDIYDLPNHLDQQFDIVFTSYGVIGWLPDMNKWAKVVSRFLKPGGIFYFVEFHPVVWMYDEKFKTVAYSYFNKEPIIENFTGTYADKTSDIEQKTITWNHPISEVINNLLSQNLEILCFNEYDYSPYDCFEETIKVSEDKFRIKHMKDHLPMVYALKANKRS